MLLFLFIITYNIVQFHLFFMFYEDFDMYILNPVNSESLMNITDMADEAGHPLIISGYFSGTDNNFAEVAYNYDDIIRFVG